MALRCRVVWDAREVVMRRGWGRSEMYDARITVNELLLV